MRAILQFAKETTDYGFIIIMKDERFEDIIEEVLTGVEHVLIQEWTY
jgi:hypothetical protein